MRALGCLPDPADDRDCSLAAWHALSDTPPPSASVQRFMTSIPNQLNSSSCVGQAMRQAYHIAEYAKLGHKPEDTSAMAHYFNARAQTGVEDIDAGTWIRAGMTALKYFGAVRDRFWPFDMSKINTRPPFRAYKDAFKTKGPHQYYRIMTEGEARLNDMRRCIAAGTGAVVLGTKVSREFMDDGGPSIADRPKDDDEIVGGHAMCVVAYEPGRFLLANSWGTNYRLNGCVWVTEEYITWERTHDIWALVL